MYVLYVFSPHHRHSANADARIQIVYIYLYGVEDSVMDHSGSGGDIFIPRESN